MENIDVNYIREHGWIIYEYIRGSHLHGTATDKSDIDIGGVFIIPKEYLMGHRNRYIQKISDKKNDIEYYELGFYFELLMESNPSMIESLHVPDEYVRIKKPIMQKILDNKDVFLSKNIIKKLKHYGEEQSHKALGYKKLCSYPEDMKRKQPIDFCYTFNDKQGTGPITSWLESRGLKQIYCGLNRMQNMNMMHGVFYDWPQHLHMEYPTLEDLRRGFENVSDNENTLTQDELFFDSWTDYCCSSSFETIWKQLVNYYNNIKPKGYHGIVKEDGKSCDVHLDSILKEDRPICYMSYNKDGYSSHCKLYNEWLSWKEKRNPIRYESNYGTGYDSKNMSEEIRLLSVGHELALNKGFICDRRLVGQRELLLDIKSHKYTYNEIIKIADEIKQKIDEAMDKCTLKDDIDKNFINDMLIEIRNEYYAESNNKEV